LDLYSLVVEEFTIVDTRSVFTDTVVISESAHIDGGPVRFSWRSLGDLDNGTYTGELTDVVINNHTSMVAFTFQLLNAGSGNMNDGALSARTAATADQLVGIISNLAPAAAAGVAATVARGTCLTLGWTRTAKPSSSTARTRALIRPRDAVAIPCTKSNGRCSGGTVGCRLPTRPRTNTPPRSD
jgi:hypothetical protein